MGFKDFISSLRMDMGLSQRELARMAQISHTEIYRLENGARHQPSLVTLKKLAPVLGVSLEQLMEAAGYIEINPKVIGSQAGFVPDKQEYRYGLDNGSAELPILGKDGGNLSGYFDLKGLKEIDFALRVANNRLIGAGLYRGDLALCSRNPDIAGARVLVIESLNGDKRELSLILNNEDSLQVCECDPKSGSADGELRIIGKVLVAVRNIGWEAENEDATIAQWLELANTAKRLGFTPEHMSWMIKKQAQLLKMLGKK